MFIKVINRSKTLSLPEYKTSDSSGMDIKACFDCEIDNNGNRYSIVKISRPGGLENIKASVGSEIVLKPGQRCLIPTGLMVNCGLGHEFQVRPRSGLALTYGITVLNTPGTIDADYRGMIGVILINHGLGNFTIKHGDRIAQLVLKPTTYFEWEVVNDLTTTERGEGGFGHTGI